MAVGRSFRLVFLPPQRSRAIPPSSPPWQQPRVRSRYEKGPSAPPPLLFLRSFSFLRPRGLFSGKIWRRRRRLYSAVCALLCVATAAFSRPSLSGVEQLLSASSLTLFVSSCGVVGGGNVSLLWMDHGDRRGPAPLRPPLHFGGGGTAASCDSSTDRPRRSMRPLHASLPPFLRHEDYFETTLGTLSSGTAIHERASGENCTALSRTFLGIISGERRRRSSLFCLRNGRRARCARCAPTKPSRPKSGPPPPPLK